VEIRYGGEAETGRTAAETVFDDEPSVRIRCSNAVDVTAEPRGRGRKSPLCERGGHEVLVQDDALRTGFECGDDAPGSPQLVGETGRQILEFVVIESDQQVGRFPAHPVRDRLAIDRCVVCRDDHAAVGTGERRGGFAVFQGDDLAAQSLLPQGGSEPVQVVSSVARGGYDDLEILRMSNRYTFD